MDITTTDLLDPEIAGRIDDMGPEMTARIWKATLTGLPRLKERISFSLHEGDLLEAVAAAHAGKGSTGTVGLLALSKGLSRLIDLAQAGKLESAREHWNGIEPLVERSIAAVAKHHWKA